MTYRSLLRHSPSIRPVSHRSNQSESKIFQNQIASKFNKMSSNYLPPFIGSIDNGTSSTRFLIFDSQGKIVSKSQAEYAQYTPKPGWREQDLVEILDVTNKCIEAATTDFIDRGFKVGEIKGIGIANQRETTCAWSRSTGSPLHRAIVWLDVRTKDLVKDLISKTRSKLSSEFVSIVGLPLSTYFSALKMRWMLDHVVEISDANTADDLMFGTIDSWLLYNLTGGVDGGIHQTDVSNASRTMLMNLKSLEYDDGMLKFFGIKIKSLPAIKSSSHVYGRVKSGILAGIPIAGILGDQHAALLGQLCCSKGDVKSTYGTGCFMLCNTGLDIIESKHGLLTTVAYKFGDDECVYALEGSIAIAGAAVQWLRDQIGVIRYADEVGQLADSVDDSGGCYFVPAFTGLFAPYWRDDARGTIVGLTQSTNKAHLCRATLEAISFQTKDILICMESDTQTSIKSLKVDGGMSISDTMMQIQADVAGIDLYRPDMLETTAFGAAVAAGVAVGVYSIEGLQAGYARDTRADLFRCGYSEDKRESMYCGWKKAVQKSMDWA